LFASSSELIKNHRPCSFYQQACALNLAGLPAKSARPAKFTSSTVSSERRYLFGMNISHRVLSNVNICDIGGKEWRGYCRLSEMVADKIQESLISMK